MRLRSSVLTALLAGFFLVTGGIPFWQKVMQALRPFDASDLVFMVSLVAVVFALNLLLLNLVAFPRVFKPAAILLIFINAAAFYFSMSYGVLVDTDMVRNVFETDAHEAFELLAPGFWVAMLLLGVLPSVLFGAVGTRYARGFRNVRNRTALITGALLLIAANAFLFDQTYASFGRNHHEIIHYLAPVNAVSATFSYLGEAVAAERGPPAVVGSDADIERATRGRVLVLVVGETATASHFSILGYGRPTSPRLEKRDVVAFGRVSSCGTSTAVSLPCMFSPRTREEYEAGENIENLLDVLARAGVDVTWRDNNSGCKDVCARVEYEWTGMSGDDCTGDACFDAALLDGLGERLQQEAGDLLLVLHQLGSHGPAYFKRYPQEFERFQPVCRDVELEHCTQQEIRNAYDNSIFYTDYVLDQLISKVEASGRQAAVLYVSDHGESLGEHGLYLHGLPYMVAPEMQKHVPEIFWMSPTFATATGIDERCLAEHAQLPYSHDNLFHSVLGLFDVRTQAYDPALDVFKACRS